MMDSGTTDLDGIDRVLLRALLQDGRQTHAELSARAPLSPTACARRIKRMEEQGIIRGYSVELDADRLGFGTTVMVQIALERQTEDCLAAFEAAVAGCGSVVSCFLMSGSDDYLLRVAVRDLRDFERVHKEELSRLPHVTRLQSSFALREVVRRPVPRSVVERR